MAFIRSDDPKINFNTAQPKPAKIEDTTSGPGAPDIEIITAPVAFLDHGALDPGPNCFSVVRHLHLPTCVIDHSTVVITLNIQGPILLRPLSLGTVSIPSASPFDKAVVDPNYLSNPNDLKILIRGVRLCMRIGHTEALKSMLDLKAN